MAKDDFRSEVYLSEYGADCFDINGDNAYRCSCDRVYAADRWFPFCVDGVHVGYIMIGYDGSTFVRIRALEGHDIEVKAHEESMALYEELATLEWGTEEYHKLEAKLEKLDAKIQRECNKA